MRYPARRYLTVAAGAAALIAAACGTAFSDARPGAASGAWAAHVQVLLDAAQRSVRRQEVKVWDAQPEKNLDFTWEPDAGQDYRTGAAGGVSGEGRLTWRVKGSPSYDRKTVFSVYRGTLEDGRPSGRGRLESRSGAVLEGVWRDGLLNGIGLGIDANGDRYEGEFVDGERQGQGVLRLSSGEIYSGAFAHGLRHGKGRMRLPGGTSYDSEWTMGREISATRPDRLADASLGGLVRAGTSGGDAGKVSLGLSIDQRMTQQSDIKYQQLVGENDVAIFPEQKEMNDAWNGARTIDSSDFIFTGTDWENAPAFMQVDLATGDGSRVKLDRLDLDVATSDVYRKPMLSLVGHLGCVGFRPDASFTNNGWGAVKDARMTVAFSSPDYPVGNSPSYTADIGSFDTGADVSFLEVLKQAGVDTEALGTQRFSCPSMEGMAICKSKVLNAVKFGAVRDYVWGDDKLTTTAKGTIEYTWSDDQGNVYPAKESFAVDIALATIETPASTAECGDGVGNAPEALRYQDIHLRLGAKDYSMPLQVRGNKSVKTFVGRLKVHADQTSFHTFSAVARFADGSERRSKPVSLYYFRPRGVTFSSAVKLPACYLTEDAGC